MSSSSLHATRWPLVNLPVSCVTLPVSGVIPQLRMQQSCRLAGRGEAHQDEGVEEVAAALDLRAVQHAQHHHDHGRQRRVAQVVLQLPHRQRLRRAQRVQLVDHHLARGGSATVRDGAKRTRVRVVP